MTKAFKQVFLGIYYMQGCSIYEISVIYINCIIN